MNRSKKIISLLISMVLCALLPTFVWAVDSDGIEYSATIETPEITVSEEAQTVVITVKTDEIISYDGFEGRITLPSNDFVVESIETADKDAVSVLYNPANGKFLTDSDGAEIIESDTLLKITLTVPAGASEGTYATIIWFDELTSDYGEVFANNITVTAVLKIVEPEVETGLKGDVDLNGVVDMDDVVMLMRHVLQAEIITNPTSLEVAEVTNDATLDMDDVVKLMQYVLKAIDSLD